MIYVMFCILALLVGFCGYKYIKQILIFFHLDLKKKYVKVLHWIVTLSAVGICMNLFSVPAIIVLYTLLFAGVFNLLFWILQRILRRREKGSGNLKILQGRFCLLPVVLAILFIGYGAVNMNRIHHTIYDIATDKIDGSYEIALVTDTHYGTVQNTDLLKEEMEALSKEKPDLLILRGDIVEEGTSRKQMEEVFRIFGSVDTKYGVYFVYGNHDQQHYTAEKAYSKAELEQVLAENDITLLADTYAEIDSTLILAGRDDAGYGLPGSRKAMEALLQGVSREKYLIVTDHQPVDVGECASAGVDLMLSGHTHAGQIWPLGLLLQISGNYNYGLYDGETCKVIVSSGFTGWGYPVRTEGKCEYVLIRLNGGAKEKL